jgi:hypothetical protein
MRTYDLSTSWRSALGFDSFFDLVDVTQLAAGDDNPRQRPVPVRRPPGRIQYSPTLT